jgi:pantetheine-phosphate adenylyltransferase
MSEVHHIQHVVVPGTFDPVTLGHIDVIRRARKLFPYVTVAVAESKTKRGTSRAFTLEERVAMLREALAEEGLVKGVDVQPFTGLLVDFCRQVGAGGVVKGLRAMTDFEYELQQADLNSHMAPDLESIFVMSSPQFTYVSSSVVREIASLGRGHERDLALLVPPNVARCLRERYAPAE